MLSLAECREQFPGPLTQATLAFLVRRDGSGRIAQVLLAMKKVRFGAGMWNGVGGKQEPQDESPAATAAREAGEEIFVTIDPVNLIRVATLDFYFPHQPAWNQHVHAYLIEEWEGEPRESEEMKPQWFAVEEVPYDEMWADDAIWLPKVLAGKVVAAGFVYRSEREMVEYEMRECN